MQVAKFEQIKEKLLIKDEELFIYQVEPDGSLKLTRLNEYEVLAEEGLKEVYENEPLGLWEQCLES